MQEEEAVDEELEVIGNQLQDAENSEVSVGDEDNSGYEIFEEKRSLLDQTKISKQTWSISEIYQKMKANQLILDPNYQRNYVWNIDKQTAFIESLFMGIVIPPIYVVEISTNDPLEATRYEIVDGKQRLSTLLHFIENDLKLSSKSLEYYQDLFGDKKFHEINEGFKEQISEMLSSVLDIYVITANSPEFIKYDIFSRLNKGSQALKVNEIRKAIYKSPLTDYIDNFVKDNLDKEFYTAIFTKNDIKRFEDYGRFFRSIAFYKQIDIENKRVDGYNSRPRDMINNVLAKFQDDSFTIAGDKIKKILDGTIELSKEFKDKDKTNWNYLVDLAIYFKVQYPNEYESKKELINGDTRIKDTFIKSSATTSMVNQRLDIMTEIILGK